MKKRVFTGLFAVVVLVFFACASAQDQHTSQNSLDWAGVYTGTLPGANSDIKTELTLNQDGTYTITTQYVDKGPEVFTDTGSFTWKDGSTIALDTKENPPYYKVGENKLTQLDMEGKPITGSLASMYVLTKQ
jgi:uncharacterized lipoprotein NlpE involved in copper resistance